MGVYDRQIAQALRMIKAKGQLVTWIKTALTPDPTQPWKSTSSDTPTTFPVSIVFTSKGKNIVDTLFHLMKGTSVPDGAPFGLMAQVPFTPEVTDTILRGDQNFKISSIDIVAPNGEPILYKIGYV